MQLKKPTFDENVFVSGKTTRIHHRELIYNSAEMLEIIEYLESFFADHPICLVINRLLNTTINFRSATTLNIQFVAMRMQKPNEAKIKAALDEMAKKLADAEHQLSALDNHSSDYQLLSSAIAYCKKSVRQRIAQLKASQDVIYEKYWPGSLLQKLLEEKLH